MIDQLNLKYNSTRYDMKGARNYCNKCTLTNLEIFCPRPFLQHFKLLLSFTGYGQGGEERSPVLPTTLGWGAYGGRLPVKV